MGLIVTQEMSLMVRYVFEEVDVLAWMGIENEAVT